MLFNSLPFYFFFPIVTLGYFLLPLGAVARGQLLLLHTLDSTNARPFGQCADHCDFPLK
jgi:hypothetical protein